jgi:hypothetical protein
MKSTKNAPIKSLTSIFFAKSVKSAPFNEDLNNDSNNQNIDLSKVNFSFLEDELELGWKDTSVAEQKKLSLSAYNKYAY